MGLAEPPAFHTGSMQIILDITQDATGHLTGTAAAAGGTGERTFYGAMELLSSIEELCEPDAGLNTAAGALSPE